MTLKSPGKYTPTRFVFKDYFHAEVVALWTTVMNLLLGELIMKFINASYSEIEAYLFKAVRSPTTCSSDFC